MIQLADHIKHVVAAMGGLWGGFGLLLVAFFDSSFVSLPEVNDLLIVYFCTKYKERAYYYALMASVGSTAGCSVLYWIGRWKGYPYLERRYARTRMERALRVYQRYGVLAVVGPAILPPPLPFKIFVFTAGICKVAFSPFLLSVFAARTFRYSFEAALAIRFGDQALAYVKENYLQVAFTLLALLAAGGALYVAMDVQRRRRRPAGPTLPTPPR